MSKLDKTIAAMRNNPKNVHFDDLFGVCLHFFGSPRQQSGSHAVFCTPWQGSSCKHTEQRWYGKGVSGEASFEGHRQAVQ